jgi:hypothetical protein
MFKKIGLTLSVIATLVFSSLPATAGWMMNSYRFAVAGCAASGISFIAGSNLGSGASPKTAPGVSFGAEDDCRVITVATYVINDGGSAVSVTGVTVGGTAATKRAGRNVNSSIDYDVALWTAKPTGTSGDIVITYSGTASDQVSAGAWRVITSGDSDGVPSDSGDAADAGPLNTVTIPTSGFGIFSCGSSEEGGTISMTNAGTERYDLDSGTDGGHAGYDSSTAGTPSVVCTNSAGGTEGYAGIAFGP